MASDVLGFLIRSNLVAAAAILLVLAARPLLRRLAGAHVAYAAWLMVPLAVAACIVPPRSVVSVLPQPAAHLALPHTPAIPPAMQPARAPQAGIDPTPAADVPFDGPALLVLVWLAGAVLALAWPLWRQRQFLAGIRPTTRDGLFLRALRSTVGPAVVGVLSPRILLPADFDVRFSAREQQVVLAHEQIHIARGDTLINALVIAWQCLNWFNPLVHLAARWLRLDQELACDASVMALFPNARRSYAEALLKAQIAPLALPLGCYWPARPPSALRRRLIMLRYASPSRGRLVLGAAAAVLIGVGAGLGAWAAQAPRRIVIAQAKPEDVVVAPPPAQAARSAPLAPLPAPAKIPTEPPVAAVEPATAPDPLQSVVAVESARVQPSAPATAPGEPPRGLLTQLETGRHERFVQLAQAGDIELLFVGDSSTDWWRTRGRTEWDRNYAELKAANFGCEGSSTQSVLWRMQNGELDGYKAKVIVLMLGIQNIARNEPIADIARGEAAILDEFRNRQPQARILLLGVFPRGESPDSATRAPIRALNAELAKLADNRSIFYMDIGSRLLTADGTLPPEMTSLGLQPKGYAIWAGAMNPKLMELMR